jgi:hypothetical protein
LLLILAILSLLRLVVPQQATPDVSAAQWASALSPGVRPYAAVLYVLGLSRLLQSGWLWVLLSLILLNSLVAMADYAGPTWRRVRGANSAANLNWRHPLAHRLEKAVRLPEAVDPFLDGFKESLRARGFSINVSVEESLRMVSAGRRGWAWFGPLVFYAGLALLCVAYWVSYRSLEHEQVTLFPREPNESRLLDGSLELSEIDAANGSGTLVFTSIDNDTSVVRWRLYRPGLFAGLLILPLGLDPVLSVEATDSTGDPVKLVPLRDDLSPAVRLNLPLDRPEEALYFLIPSPVVAFRISPASTPGEPGYEVQVKRSAEASPTENLLVRLDEPFEVDGYAVTISLTHNVTLDVRRDLALPIYAISVLLIVASGIVLLAFPAWEVWLAPEVKGRGGRLYIIVEKLGLGRGTADFLQQLLVENAPDEQEA